LVLWERIVTAAREHAAGLPSPHPRAAHDGNEHSDSPALLEPIASARFENNRHLRRSAMTRARMLTGLLCSGLSTLVYAHDLIRECPSSAIAISDQRIHSELIWAVTDGTSACPRKTPGDALGLPLAAVLAPDSVLELLISGSFAEDTTCRLEGVFEFADQNGVPQEELPPVVLTGDGFTFTLYQPTDEGSRQQVRYRLNEGKATGCTLEELSTIVVTATVLKRMPDVEEVCSGLACAEPQSSQRLQPVFFQFPPGPTGAVARGNRVSPQPPLRPIDLQCRAAGQRQIRSGDNVSPSDDIWDLSGGTTSTGVKQSTELLIFVTPKIVRPEASPSSTVTTCEERTTRGGYAVDFVPKVKVEVLVDDDKGNQFTESLALDAETQSAILNYPYIDGGVRRYLQRVKVLAKGSPCFDVQATLYTVDAESGNTLADLKLPAVVSKAVPPPAFAGGDGATDRTH
jgi:hypothetical protein